MNHIVKSLLLPILGLLLVSCLNSANDIEQGDQLILTLLLDNVNEEIVAGNDTLSILRLDFLVGSTFLHNANGDTLLISQNTFQISHTNDPLNQELKGLAQGNFTSEVIYNTLNFEIKKAEATDAGKADIDDAFVEGEAENQRFSMIVNGTYNGEAFEFKSTRNFNYELTFQDQSGGTPGNLIYNLNMETNLNSWFQNPEGEGLLDPGEAANASTINDRIESSVTLN